MSDDTMSWKATKQQLILGIVSAIIIGLLSTLGAGILNMMDKIEENETQIQAIQLALPDGPTLQRDVNMELNLMLASLKEDVEDITITDGQTSMKQALLLNKIQMDLVKINTTLGLDK